MTTPPALKPHVLVPSRARFWILASGTVFASFIAGFVVSVGIPMHMMHEQRRVQERYADKEREALAQAPQAPEQCSSARPGQELLPVRRTLIQSTVLASLMAELVPQETASNSVSARFMPQYECGAMSGVRIDDLRPYSTLAILGLQSGDVIYEVDGVPLTNQEALWGMHRLLRTPQPGTTRIEIERERVPLTIIANLL